MPKNIINYDNTIIYKLCCNDMTIKDIYVGHTTNFIKRKQCHKNCCNSSQNKKHHLYKYEFIRNNGGWNNWSMIEIIKVKCIDVYEACKIERQYIEELGATLNKYMPIILETEKKEYYKKYYKEYYKNYNQINKDKIKLYYENYNQINKDKIKLYYEINKNKIKERNKRNKEIREG
jgi:hypothetical protein